MFDFHKDKGRYFSMQKEVASDFIITYLETLGIGSEKMHVLEIGCAEAGVLSAFIDKGHTGLGIELSEGRVKLAKQFLKEEIASGQVDIIQENIYDIDPDKDLDRKFDLIILKDVIEHIPEQERFIPALRKFLNPGGKVFLAFPPWYMPFGGHQQLCTSKLLGKLPWFHLMPMKAYLGFLKMMGEPANKIEGLREIKETGISIERMVKLSRISDYKIIDKKFWLFNPIYKYKFNLRPRKVFSPLTVIPGVRNFYTTALYIVIGI